MLGRNHALSGAVGYLAVGPLTTPSATLSQHAIGTVVCAAWALAPDLDHPGATVSRSLGPGGRAASAGVRALSGGHRQGTHSLLASLAVAGFAWWMAMMATTPVPAAIAGGVGVAVATPLLGKAVGLAPGSIIGAMLGGGVGWLLWTGTVPLGEWFFVAVALGFALHWVGDALTPQGVPLLWPFTRWRLKVPLFTTGSPLEAVASAALLVATIVLAWGQFSPALPWT